MSKMVKKNAKYVKNWQKNPKKKKLNIYFLKKYLKILKTVFFSAERKKCYSLSFANQGNKSSTRALQSTPFQNPGGVTKDEGRTKDGNPRV